MQKKCDSPFQLSFDFEAPMKEGMLQPELLGVSNVVHVEFGGKSVRIAGKSVEDKAILEQVLINARKLKW